MMHSSRFMQLQPVTNSFWLALSSCHELICLLGKDSNFSYHLWHDPPSVLPTSTVI